jgi:3-oxoacyl-[acyl-carrier protein] reductase/bacilysin biosynthesis oxidoreductase BacG
MQLGLESKVAIVTGGSKGIGRATALSLLNEGASVLIAARGQQGLDEMVSSAGEAAKGRLHALAADLSDGEAIKRTVAECLRVFGRIDVLVNNAGSARSGPFQQLPDQAWQDDWNLKFFGYVRMAREALAHMQAQGSGVIVNIIGAAAFSPTADYMIGGAANLALNHFTKALAKEAAPYGVRVVGINPGPIGTDRFEIRIANRPQGMSREEYLQSVSPLGRAGRPEEVGDLVTFMVSERASFISGTNLTIDGAANSSIMG